MKLRQTKTGLFRLIMPALILFSAAEAAADVPGRGGNVGLHYINARGEVRCGTDLSTKTYAYKDKSGQWQGIDADFCRLFSLAVFGDSSHFSLVDVRENQISHALATNRIDLMLGGHSLPAAAELNSRAGAVDILYYDREMLLAADEPEGSSMETFRGAAVCAVRGSENMENLREYNRQYQLDFNILAFPDQASAKAAFYLRRCQLLAGNEIYLRGVAKKVVSKNLKPKILPEVISRHPVYAYADNYNNRLRVIGKWILNAPKLAEDCGINKQNVKIFIGSRDKSTRNLLGDNPDLWKAFGLQEDWVRKATGELGNYGEIFEKNLGRDSEIRLDRDKNHLIKNDGLIPALKFI